MLSLLTRHTGVMVLVKMVKIGCNNYCIYFEKNLRTFNTFYQYFQFLLKAFNKRILSVFMTTPFPTVQRSSPYNYPHERCSLHCMIIVVPYFKCLLGALYKKKFIPSPRKSNKSHNTRQKVRFGDGSSMV